jgi:hypothetical protein
LVHVEGGTGRSQVKGLAVKVDLAKMPPLLEVQDDMGFPYFAEILFDPMDLILDVGSKALGEGLVATGDDDFHVFIGILEQRGGLQGICAGKILLYSAHQASIKGGQSRARYSNIERGEVNVRDPWSVGMNRFMG